MILPSRSRPSMLVVLVAMLLAGCGGSREDGHTYAWGTVASCLRGGGWDVTTNQADLDYIAQDAGEGAIEATSGANSVTITFDRTTGDAERTRAAYQAFFDGMNSPSSDVLSRDGNAVLAWERTPSAGERETVDGCLY